MALINALSRNITYNSLFPRVRTRVENCTRNNSERVYVDRHVVFAQTKEGRDTVDLN